MTDHIAARGLRLAADIGGPEDGPTVVLLHGGGQTRHSWAGTWRVLVDAGWRAISLDLRGHGDSDWSDEGDYSLDAFVDDLRTVVGTLPSPPVLVGASLGGLASLVAVAEAPVQEDVARAIVLVDVAHRVEESGRDRIGAFMTGNIDGFASLEEAADAIAAYNPHRPRPKDLSGLAKNLRQRDDGRWVWHWDPRFVMGQLGSADETRASVVDPVPAGEGGRRPGHPGAPRPGPQQRPPQRGRRPGLHGAGARRRVRGRRRGRSHGRRRPQRDLQPGHPRVPRTSPPERLTTLRTDAAQARHTTPEHDL